MLFLVKAGVPWDEAWGMSSARRLACIVIVREQDGESFDWDAMRFRERK